MCLGNGWLAADESELSDELFPSWDGLAELGLGRSYGPVEALALIEDVIASMPSSLVHPGAKIDPGAKITNSIICDGVEVYEGATIRDSIVLGGTTVGHCSEVARSLIMGGCFVPRFNYVGGSLLGAGSNLGGMATFASRRHDDRPVVLSWGDVKINTGRWKFGSLVGEGCTIAFASHVNPGSVVGKGSLILPYVDIRGYIPPDSIILAKQKIAVSTRRDMLDMEQLQKRWSE